MPNLSGSNLQETIVKIRDYLGNPADLKELASEDGSGVILYYEGLVREDKIRQLFNDFPATFKEVAEAGAALDLLPQGYALIIRQEDQKPSFYAISLPGWQLRPIEEPISEPLIRGPREGFTETILVNTAMIRRWIHDPKFRVDEMTVGTRTKTSVRILYISDIAAPELVKEVKRRISEIEIDGILESGYLEQLITDNRLTVFPLIQSTERTDTVAAAVLEGRVAILADKSPFALIVPTTINELYQSPEDYYHNFYLGSFLRFFRLLGNIIAVTFSGLYVGLASCNPELLPTSFAFSIAQSRRGIPYPLVIEVLFLEIMLEVFREAGLRLPKNVSFTLGAALGIALAFAGIQSHLVSGTTLLIVTVGGIASFTAPSFSVGIPWRIFKFLLILGAAFMGMVGLTLMGILILAHAATLTSFGTSYLAPWAPIQPKELRDSVFRVPLWLRFTRPKTYRPHDRQRMANTQNEAENDE
jgi:hypothetical protein